MKKTLFLLLFATLGIAATEYAYARCTDVSSCSSELSDIENSRKSTADCYRIYKGCFIPDCGLCDQIFAGNVSSISTISKLEARGYTKVFENCEGGVWCKNKPVERKPANSSSRYTANNYRSSYSSSSYDDDDDDDDSSSLYFSSLSDEKGLYEINKDNIDVGYYGNISFGYPDGEGNIFYYDDMVYVGSFKLGDPSGSGVLLTKNGYLSGTWSYGVFRQSRTLPASLIPLTTSVSRKNRQLANKMLFVKYYEIDANSSQGRLLLKRFKRSCRSYY